jgi:hypothetical protein
MWELIRSPWRGLLLAAGLILAGTAVLQASGYPLLARALEASALSETWVSALRGLWVMFAVHLAVIALYLGAGALRPGLIDDRALFVCALLLATNTGLLGGLMGLFAGTLLVGIATVTVIVARLIRGTAMTRQAGENSEGGRRGERG